MSIIILSNSMIIVLLGATRNIFSLITLLCTLEFYNLAFCFAWMDISVFSKTPEDPSNLTRKHAISIVGHAHGGMTALHDHRGARFVMKFHLSLINIF